MLPLHSHLQLCIAETNGSTTLYWHRMIQVRIIGNVCNKLLQEKDQGHKCLGVPTVVGWIMAPLTCLYSNILPGAYECVTSHGKRELADVIKSRFLRWGDYPGLSRWPQCNYKVSYVKEVGGLELERWKYENRRRGGSDARSWAKAYEQLLEAGKGKETDFPLEVPEGMECCQQLDSSPLRLRLDFRLPEV